MDWWPQFLGEIETQLREKGIWPDTTPTYRVGERSTNIQEKAIKGSQGYLFCEKVCYSMEDIPTKLDALGPFSGVNLEILNVEAHGRMSIVRP